MERMVLARNTEYLEDINVGRECTGKAVNQRVARNHIIDKQRVGSRDVTMDIVVVHTISVSVIFIGACSTQLVVQTPSRLIVSLDGWLHEQCTTKYICHVTVETLDILRGVGDTHTVLTGVRVRETGTELDELRLHRVVDTGCETLVVWTCALECAGLLEVVKTYVVCALCTTAAQVDVVVLAHTGLEHFLKPVSVRVVLEMICVGSTVVLVTTWKRGARILT